MRRPIHVLSVGVLTLMLASCGGGDEGGGGNGTGGADAGDDGSVGGAAGVGGTGTGATGGTSVGGTGGTGGAAGSGGVAGSGTGGAAGSGTGGAAGSGTGGAAGSGTGGAAGSGTGGAAGSGTGGAAGSGTGGTGGFDSTCYLCHGTVGNPTPAPPKDTSNNTATTNKGVGAHQSHLAAANWHAPVTCEQCHLVPKAVSDVGHMDTSLPAEVLWDPTDLARADSANPSWGGTTCNGVYCHGSTLMGSGANTTPTWTTVDGSQKACGTSCHTLPPGGTHPVSTNCPQCHGAVIASFTPGSTPTATWADPNKHINGTVEFTTGGLTCTSCHGNKSTNDPSPPLGAGGETLTTQAAVGAHQEHLASASWHKQVVCADCHTLPTSTSHSNGTDDFTWSTLATGSGSTTPSYGTTNFTCSGVYCHGSTLMGPSSGGSTKTSPVWNTVDGTYDACGSSCHTNPPGGTHLAKTNCPACHSAVITTYTPGSPSTNVWADPQKHVNGTVETSMTCTSCHGTPPNQNNPPVGVGGETTTNTLAVGRHVAHLTASSTHVAFACGTCHTVPQAGDTAHAAQYVASANLSTAGHHGDVTFSAPATNMTWNVNATQGNPVTARGTCIGACHSNGRGGNPVVTPYWAGGTWNTGSCGSCHQATPQTGEHNKHVNGENLGCNVCHPGANTSTHMNGQWDLHATINGPNGGSLTTTPPGGVCGQNWGCKGTCHNQNHSSNGGTNPDCW